MPVDAYRQYLALKNHFTKDSYDYHKYCGKSRASVQSFYKRKDRMWFEKVARQKSDQEVIEFFVSNFVSVDSPESVYIPDIIRDGEEIYINWKKRIQSLTYMFQTEVEVFLGSESIDSFFSCQPGIHSSLIKKHLQKALSIETLVILDYILNYVQDYDKVLDDPVWETLSLKISKYKPFLNISIQKYTDILKKVVL